MKNFELIRPQRLLFDIRLDLACKYLLISQFDSKNPNYEIFDLYARHISKRNGAIEPYDRYVPNQKKKNNVKDFIESARELYYSIKTNGFDKNFAIHYHDTNFANGAHRIAISTFFDVDIAAVKIPNKKTIPWDSKWFLNNGFTEQEVNLLLETREKMK